MVRSATQAQAAHGLGQHGHLFSLFKLPFIVCPNLPPDGPSKSPLIGWLPRGQLGVVDGPLLNSSSWPFVPAGASLGEIQASLGLLALGEGLVGPCFPCSQVRILQPQELHFPEIPLPLGKGGLPPHRVPACLYH